ncbi:MAG: hypothetical protein H7Y09_11270 [Chitinophagaceae bacterium]|nr:hypothetical protein [Anaerolineae bacterium]
MDEQIAFSIPRSQSDPSPWLIRAFYRALPINNSSTPLLDHELRGGGWTSDSLTVLKRSLKRLRVVTGGIVGLWGIVALLFLLMPSQRSYQTLESLIGMVLYASLLDKFIFDALALLTNLGSISEDVERGRWDLVCLSDVSMREFINAKHAAGQMRVWKTTLNVIGSRLAVVLLFPLHYYLLPLLVPGRLDTYSPLENIHIGSIYDVLNLIFVHLILLLMAAVYVVEPLWRLRTLAAAGLDISSRLTRPTFAVLWSLGTFINLWGVQVMLFIAAAGLGSWFSYQAYVVRSGFSSTPVGEADVTFAMLIFALLIAAAIYATYRWLTHRNLLKATKRLVKLGGAA